MTTDPEEVLQFWLETVGPKRWYQADSALDDEIRARFGELWKRAGAGACDHWMISPRAALALMIVLDQFPRNMFRGTAEAFSTDGHALALAKQAIDHGQDREMPEPERQFFYLPLLHSEVLADQEHCVRVIKMGMPETGKEQLEHAQKHRAVIREFGRFPGRNAALGRHDTEAELRYRESGGYQA